jgi:hypothetical protein
MSEFKGFEKSSALAIPPGFLLQVVAQEKGSVIRVVGYILSRTLEGRDTVEAGYQDFMHHMKLSRQAVQEGLARALEAGYIRLVRQGGGVPSVYTLNWLEEEVEPPGPPDPEPGSNNRRPETEPEHNLTEKGYVGLNPAEPAAHTASTTSGPTSASSRGTGGPYPEISSPTNPIPPFSSPENQTARRRSAFQAATSPATTPFTSQPAFQTGYYRADSRISLELEYKLESGASYRKADRPRSTFLTSLTRDFSLALGDPAHLTSNLTQTHNLWHKSGLSEKEFAALLYRARFLTARYAVLRPGEPSPPPGLPRNRMAYFFTVLRDLVDNPVHSYGDNSPFSGDKPPLPGDNQSSPAPRYRSSWASHPGFALADGIPPTPGYRYNPPTQGQTAPSGIVNNAGSHARPGRASKPPAVSSNPGRIPDSWRRMVTPPPLERYLEEGEHV